MATQTFLLCEFSGVRVEFDVNDANWRVTQVRCWNSSPYTVAAIILQNGTEVFTATALAQRMTSWNTSGVQLGWDSVDGGIIMNGYVMRIRFPA